MYLIDTVKINSQKIRQAATIGWIPYAASGVGSLCGGWLSSRLLSSGHSVNAARKIALKDLRGALPADTPTVTPQQREAILRDRRATLQQRPLW